MDFFFTTVMSEFSKYLNGCVYKYETAKMKLAKK